MLSFERVVFWTDVGMLIIGSSCNQLDRRDCRNYESLETRHRNCVRSGDAKHPVPNHPTDVDRFTNATQNTLE